MLTLNSGQVSDFRNLSPCCKAAQFQSFTMGGQHLNIQYIDVKVGAVFYHCLRLLDLLIRVFDP